MGNNYVDLEIPDDIKKRIIDFLKSMLTTTKRNDKDVPVIKREWKIKRGLVENAKALERNQLKFLIIAGDIDKPELAEALPKIAQEKKIPYGFVDSKADMGKACGMKIECSAVGIMEVPKEADTEMKAIIAAIGSKK